MPFTINHATDFTAAANAGPNAGAGTTLYDGWIDPYGADWKILSGVATNALANDATTGLFRASAIQDGGVDATFSSTASPLILLRATQGSGKIQTGIGVFIYSGSTLYAISLAAGVLS